MLNFAFSMAADPVALDQLFASRGGFAVAYKKLVVLAQAMLVTYGGDSASRVVLRQLDPEEIVNTAFERYLDGDSGDEGEDIYLVLRRHIKNHVRSAAKSVKQNHTVRVDGNKKSTALYNQQHDPNETGAIERVSIIDDFDFCKTLIFRVLSDTKQDKEVASLCEAIIAGFREHSDLCEFANLEKPAFDAALKRLKRKFGHALMAAEGDLKK